MRSKGILLATIVALLVAAAPAGAETYVVDTVTDLAGTTCPQGACSIRRAIVAAEQTPEDDQVVIPQGDFQLDPSFGPLQITTTTEIVGASARLTVIHAASGARVFQIAGATVLISRLTMRDGSTTCTDPHGGNLKAQTSNVLLDHVRVTNGSACSGGGLANRNGSMVIENSLIDDNRALTGGGDGGGIINFGGDGGDAATLAVRDSTIASNTARLAGGIIQYDNPGDSTSLFGVTMAFNQTGDRGGSGNLFIGSGTALLSSTILGVSLGDSGPAQNCSGTISSSGYNLADDASCSLTQPTDKPNVDARLYDGLFTDAAGETDVVPFYPDSPARDLGGSCSTIDQTDSPRPSGAACDAGAWEFRDAAMTGGPQGLTANNRPTFTFSGADAPRCQMLPVDPDPSDCSSPFVVGGPLADGAYEFRVYSSDNSYISRSFTVDATAPAAPSVGEDLSFGGEPGATLECSLDGGAFTACTSPFSASGLPPGDHTLAVRATDPAGNVGQAGARRFSVGSQQQPPPAQRTQTTSTPTAVTASSTQAQPPTPVRDQSLAGAPTTGTVLIKDRSGRFVPFTGGLLPNGSEIDATRGEVTITTAAGETAVFSGGRFKVVQRGGLTTLTLSEPLDCSTSKRGKTRTAAAAKAKAKKRRLWGDGQGKFRTQGSYSAATVRGTKWLVEDTCTTTLTRVARGVVSVRDEVLKKTVLVRAGKSYTARAKQK